MKFTSTTIKGHGRGKTLGFPTINMRVPNGLPSDFEYGVYAARAEIGGNREQAEWSSHDEKKYNVALYYGPIPTFGETELTLEMYILDVHTFDIRLGENVSVETVQFVRPVMKFDVPPQLVLQMEKDIAVIKVMLAM